MSDLATPAMWAMLWPVLAFMVVTILALALRAAILVGRRRRAGPSQQDARGALRWPSLFWCITLGLYAANEVALDAIALPVWWYIRIEMLLEAALVLSVTVVLAGIAGRGAAHVSRCAGLSAGVAGFAKATTSLGLLVAGVLVLLSALWGDSMTSWTGMSWTGLMK